MQKWSGRCFECQKWGTIVEEGSGGPVPVRGTKDARLLNPTKLSDIKKQEEMNRYKTDEPEIDRVLGGGIVKGSLLLLSGEPGIGKSTLVADVAKRFAAQNRSVLYISGEESGAQLKARFDRLKSNTEKISFLESGAIESLAKTIEKEKPEIVVIDSVQTLYSDSLESTAGSPSVVRYATSLLLELAKRNNVSILLIGQVTKDGAVAGPKTLEHLVDVVLSLDGDTSHSYRWLSCSKNRFGSTDEVGVFEMTGEGMMPVANPSARFLEERTDVPGSVIAATVEGSRVFLVEVQALVEKSSYGTPVRRASGVDQNRLQMLIAILSKRAGLQLGEQDVYVNVIGGMKLTEPAIDLAVCAAITSAVKNVPFGGPSVFVGEVGLGGEVRRVSFLEKRITETKRLGIDKIFSPTEIKTVDQLMHLL